MRKKKIADISSLDAASLTRDSIVDVATIAMLVDGDISREEGAMLGGVLARQKSFVGVSGDQLKEMMENSLVRIKSWKSQDEALADITRRIGPDMNDRAAAFGLAFAVACADGEFAENEDEFLSALADAFGLDEGQTSAMMSVIDKAMGHAEHEHELTHRHG